MEDFIIHVHNENCARFDEINHTVAASDDISAMEDQISLDLEATLFPQLRQLTNMTDASTNEMHNVCNYIVWAKANYLDLMFKLTEE